MYKPNIIVISILVYQFFPIYSDYYSGNPQTKFRLITNNETLKWPEGAIPMDITQLDHQQQTQIVEYTKLIHENSCVRFIQPIHNWPFVTVKVGNECKTDIGRTVSDVNAGTQLFIVNPSNCFYDQPEMLRQLLRLVGFAYEHNHPLRDLYINVLWKNIKPDKTHLYEKRTQGKFTTSCFPYDFESIMHFRRNDNSLYGKDTLVPYVGLDRHKVLGGGGGLSDLDVAKLNDAYNCQTKGVSPDAVTYALEKVLCKFKINC